MKKPNHDIVTVFVYNTFSKRAECSCGWQWIYRVTRAKAIADAHMHAVDTGCHVDQPLMCKTDSVGPSWRGRIAPLLYATQPKKV